MADFTFTPAGGWARHFGSAIVWNNFLLILVLSFVTTRVSSQCTNGTQEECKCQTAPVLCTIDELDNYSFSMTSFQHASDGPNPLCFPQMGAVPNNPTWFAFVAWCTSLTLFVDISNCTPFQPPTNGVQIAIYSSCGPSYTPVACNTAPADCNTNDKTLSMNNLIIGNTYYFLIDGCSGAYCDVSIDVVGVCGAAMIEPWSQPVGGPTQICIGSNAIHTVESLDGATDYHWYINGMLVAQGTEMTSFNHLWNTAGTFQLCVDASNDPCIPESDPPGQNCITVNVFDAEAGMITAMPTPVCPNGIVNITATGYNSSPGYSQYIVIANASGTIVQVVPGGSTTFTSSTCGTFTAYSYNIHSAGGNSPPVVGNNVSTLACNNGCCELEMAPFSFQDNIAPVLLNVPADITLSCFDLVPPMQDLAWTDNCDGSGMVAGMQTGMATLCAGGAYVRTWQYTDQCNNTATHAQMITIAPVPVANFVNPPADITVDCSNIPTSAPALMVTNGGSGACQISASVNAVQNGSGNVCGGAFSFTWQYTDLCNRTITHVQNVTVQTIPVAAFVNVPADITVDCALIPTSAPALSYTNGGTGPCSIAGSVPATTTGSANLCGGTLLNTWQFTDACGRTITATQMITATPVPLATFNNPPPDITITCDAIPASIPSLTYSNGLAGPCLISGTIAPVTNSNVTACGGTITSNWQFTDACNRNITHTQVITVTPAPSPTWINPPNDTTIQCSMLPQTIPDLQYTNGQMGTCVIAGSVPGVAIVNNVCLGQVVWQWQYTDPCGTTITHTRTITTNPPPPVVFMNPPADTTVSCDGVSQTIPMLTYTNNSGGACLVAGTAQGVQQGSYNSCGGQLIRTWQVTDPCGVVYMHTQTITVLPSPPPVFLNPPPDVTLNCNQVSVAPPSLVYTNNQGGVCLITGQVGATLQGSYNACGGNLSFTWTVTSPCGNTITHIQNITVLPAPPPVFLNPPADVTLSCDQVPLTPPSLSYGNMQANACAITGSVVASVTGSYDYCGGAISYLWNFTDLCGNTISHLQNVTVTPAADPQWIDPPGNVALGCDDEYEPPQSLSYTNNLVGTCAIDGTVQPVVTLNGNVYTHTWSFIHPCTGATITHVQEVTIVPIPEIVIEPTEVFICDGDVFDLSSVIVIEVNNASVTVTWHDDTPADGTNQLNSTQVSPEDVAEYYVLATNFVGCTDEAVITIYVDPLPNAGEDASIEVCQTETVNLNNQLDFDADPGGYWIDVDDTGADVGNPNSVSFQNIDPGIYHFQYVVAINDCPADTAVITVELYGPPDFMIDSVFCTSSNTEYSVVITGQNIMVSPSAGSVVPITGGVEIQHIPIATQLSFDIYDSDIQCVFTYFVSAPNCNCPMVPPPVSLGNKKICLGDTNPALEVTVGAGFIANWYPTPTGGTALALDATMYVPTVSGVGVYTFYVEAESIEFPGCVSNPRIPVTLEITALPVVNSLNLDYCDTLETGALMLNLNNWTTTIMPNPLNTLSFHSSAADALSGMNGLSMPVSVVTGLNTFYARVVNSNGCVNTSVVTVTLSALPAFTISTTPEECFMSGSTGSVSINGLSPGYSIVFNGNTYTDQFQFTDLDAGTYPLTITSLATGCRKRVDVIIEEGTQLSISNPIAVCNDNGTDTDPSDDYYSIQVSVTSSVGATTTYGLYADGGLIGYYTYGQMVSFTLPATGVAVQIMAIDTMFQCVAEVFSQSLTPCSSNCDITVDAFDQSCNDNGTPIDPTDDYYTITINASAVNGASNNQYAVLINGTLTYVFVYGQDQSFQLLASGATPTIVLQDGADVQCILNVPISPLVSCSNQCVLPAPAVQYTCSNNNTPDNPADDYYTIVFVPQATNPGVSAMIQVLVDGSLVQTVANGAQVSLILPADGAMHAIQIVDADIPGCSAQWSTVTLNPCSTLCIISLNSSQITCDDNGTPLDPGDDMYDIAWNVEAVFGATSLSYNILVDGAAAGTGVYNVDHHLTLTADDQMHVIVLQDADDSNCTFQIDVPALEPCSNDCAILATIDEIYCNNNGTNQTESDDRFYVVVFVEGVNIPSGEWSVVGSPVTGNFGTPDTLGPFLISGGDSQIVLQAVGGSCADTLYAQAPAPCSLCEQTIDAGPDAILDCGNPNAQLTVVSSEPGNAVWTDPSGGMTMSASVSVSLAGQYIATVSFPDGCVFRDTVLVTADPTLPAVWGGPDMEFNCEVKEALLSAQILVGGAGSQFEWTDQSGNVLSTTSDVLITSPGTYYIRIYDPGVDCWSGKDAVEVRDVSNEPSAIIYADPGNILSCIIQYVVLNSDKESNVVYTWIANGQSYTDSILTIYEGGTVTLVALDTITRCESMNSLDVQTLTDYPLIVIGPALPLSCDRTTVTLDASNSIPMSGAMYVWTDDSGDTLGFDPMLSVQNAGAYILELSDPQNGCTSSDTVVVDDISAFPMIQDAPDMSLPCDDESGTLSAVLTSALSGVTYNWSAINGTIIGSSTGAQLAFNGAGTYVVQVTHTLSGCADLDTIVVSGITERPNAILAEVTAANCQGVADGIIEIANIQGGTPPYAIFLNGIQISGQSVEDLSPGEYLIQIEDANGCVLDTSVEVPVSEEVMVDLEAQVTIKEGEDHLLMAGVNIPVDEIAGVQWTPSTYLSCDTCLVTETKPSETITYTVVVTDIYGCTGEAVVTIRVADGTEIFIPNIITPSNRDQVNDYFTVYSNKPETMILSLRVYDRWGATVFEKNNFAPNIPAEGWDGTYHGKPLNPAVFVYAAEIETRPGVVEILKGDVTILR